MVTPIVLYGQSSSENDFCSRVIWKKPERKTIENDPQLQVDVLKVATTTKVPSSDVFLDQRYPQLP